jgi:hypothetical protein
MPKIPSRKVVTLDENMVAILECGHESYDVYYVDDDVPCIQCTKKCRSKIVDLRGRAAVKCQRRMRDFVWDGIGVHFRQPVVSEVRWVVNDGIAADENPF